MDLREQLKQLSPIEKLQLLQDLSAMISEDVQSPEVAKELDALLYVTKIAIRQKVSKSIDDSASMDERLEAYRQQMAQQRLDLRKSLVEMPVQPAPSPWKHTTYAVGGLVEAGYAEDSDLLLVISGSRGVFDCSYNTPEDNRKIARDYNEAWREADYDDNRLEAKGIGVLEGRTIRVAGLWGGGLNTMTEDGWTLEQIFPDYPLSSIVLCPPECDLFGRGADRCVKLIEDDGVYVFGFSQTGKSFIIGTGSNLEIFSRP